MEQDKKPSRKELDNFKEELTKLEIMMATDTNVIEVENKISRLKTMLMNINRMYKVDPKDDEYSPVAVNNVNNMTAQEVKDTYNYLFGNSEGNEE